MRTPLLHYVDPEEDQRRAQALAPLLGSLPTTGVSRGQVPPISQAAPSSHVPFEPSAEEPPVDEGVPLQEGDPYLEYQRNEAMAPPEPEAAPAPMEPTPSPATDPHQEYQQQDFQAARGNLPVEEQVRDRVPTPAAPSGGAAQQSRVVSTKPGWYDFVAPPEKSAIPGVIGGVGLGILGALLARKNPGVAAGLAGLGGLSAMQSVADQPHAEYENRLSAAERQAAMHKTLSGRGEPGSLEWFRANLAARRMQNAEDEAASKAATLAELQDPNSDATRREREAAIGLVATMNLDEESKRRYVENISRMNGEQIQKYRPQLGQMAGQLRGNENAIEGGNRRTTAQVEAEQRANTEHDRRAAQGEDIKIAGEERAQEVDRQKAQIPGFNLDLQQAPNTDTVSKGRAMAGAIDRAVRSARNLRQMQEKIKSVLVQGGGDFYKAFGSDREQARILSRMQVWQNQLAAAQREIFHQGVPQQFEVALNARTNPEADSIRAFFTGDVNWDSMEDIMSEQGIAELSYLGYSPNDKHPLFGAGAAPAAAPGPQKDVAAELKKAGPEGQQMMKRVGAAAKQVVRNAGENVSAAAGAAGVKIPPAPGMVLMRNPSTGSTGWVKKENVEEKKQKYNYEVVQ